MACADCKNVQEISSLDAPYVIRKCSSCGRELKIREPGEHGIGIRTQKGDKFIIPGGWLRIHANPLKGRGQLTKAGLKWFAKMIFFGELPREASEIEETLQQNEEYCFGVLRNSDLLVDLDIENEEDADAIFERVKENQDSEEWFAYLFGMFNQFAEEAIEEGDASKAAWAMAGAERSRSMLVFKQQLEEVVWMGHSAKRLVNLLEIWQQNRTNSDEQFWQIKFNEHAYVLSQVFSVPVVFIQDNAYVGGMSIDRKDARFVDFLFSGDSSNEAILIEIKTPQTRLLGAKYRKIYKPSAELSDALVQVEDYRLSLMSIFLQSHRTSTGH